MQEVRSSMVCEDMRRCELDRVNEGWMEMRDDGEDVR